MAIDRTDEYMPVTDAFSTTAVDDRPATPSSNAVQSGWAAAEQLTTASGDFPTEFKFSDGEFTVIKFIDQTGPFAICKSMGNCFTSRWVIELNTFTTVK